MVVNYNGGELFVHVYMYKIKPYKQTIDSSCVMEGNSIDLPKVVIQVTSLID